MRRGTLFAATIMMLAAWPVAAQLPVSFSRVTGDFPVGTSPIDVVSADFNGDGVADVAAANNDSGDVSVLLGQGDGILIDVGVTFAIGSPDLAAPSAIAVGDFNGDGKIDIVVADEIGNAVSVLLNQGGSPLFGAAINTDTGTSPEDVVVGDFNKDGKLDVVTADNLDDTVTVLLGTGDGHFTAQTPIPVGAAPSGLAAVDVDGDGNLDLVVANSAGNPDTASGSLTVLKGMGDGNFAAISFCTNQPTQICHLDTDCPTTGTCSPEVISTSFDVPVGIAAADLNGDTHPDVTVVNEEGDTVSVLLGKGDLSFQQATMYSVASLPEAITTGDFDGDGKLDIASCGSFDDKVSVLTGVGDGTFNAAVSFDVGSAPSGIAVNDLNRDQKLDIISANTEGDTVSVLLNTTGQPTPTPTPGGCIGDCNGGGSVSVSELVTMVSIALGTQPVGSCLPGDADNNGKITINEIVIAINNALASCAA